MNFDWVLCLVDEVLQSRPNRRPYMNLTTAVAHTCAVDSNRDGKECSSSHVGNADPTADPLPPGICKGVLTDTRSRR